MYSFHLVYILHKEELAVLANGCMALDGSPLRLVELQRMCVL